MESLTPAQKELYDWLVEYIREHQHSPSIRQMMRAMQLKSPAPIQSRLEHLKNKGYIEWTEGRARTIRVREDVRGVPILGTIAAGFVNEAFTDDVERLDLNGLPIKSGDYALKVTGDSMIGRNDPGRRYRYHAAQLGILNRFVRAPSLRPGFETGTTLKVVLSPGEPRPSQAS